MHEARSKDELYRKIYHEPEGNIGVLRVELMCSLFFLKETYKDYFSMDYHQSIFKGRITMIDIFVVWYDHCGGSHNSLVYFIDSSGDRFLVADEKNQFHWVSTDDCELLKEMIR